VQHNGASLGQARALPASIRLGCKSFGADKRSSLLQKFVTYCRKKFSNIGPRMLYHHLKVVFTKVSVKVSTTSNPKVRANLPKLFELQGSSNSYTNLCFP
jgi:hypothetical protein